jgi:hypothetical protein
MDVIDEEAFSFSVQNCGFVWGTSALLHYSSIIMFCVRFDKETIVTYLRLYLCFKLTKALE